MKPKKKAAKRASSRKTSSKAKAGERETGAVSSVRAGGASGQTGGARVAGKRKQARAMARPRKRVGGRGGPVEPGTIRVGETAVPSILLEGDRPVTAPWSGPGQRYVLGPGMVEPAGGVTEPELPEAYGTKALFLTACDPHGLCVYWDFTRPQLRYYNQRSRHGHLNLRIYMESVGDRPEVEVALYPDSRYWFVHVPHAGKRYVGELGYYRKRDGVWVSVVRSEPVLVPPEPSVSLGAEVRFMKVPADVPLSRAEERAMALARGEPVRRRAVAEARRRGEPILPVAFAVPAPSLTVEQQRCWESQAALEEIRRSWAGSLEVTELVRRGVGALPSSPAGREQAPAELGPAVSSPLGGERPGPRGFWFNIHAELVVYGATEPDARVTIQGRPIELRPDGSFSCRFVLPDGQYTLEAMAVKADGSEVRRARLSFDRRTSYEGEVLQAPADPALGPPPRAGAGGEAG